MLPLKRYNFQNLIFLQSIATVADTYEATTTFQALCTHLSVSTSQPLCVIGMAPYCCTGNYKRKGEFNFQGHIAVKW